MTDALLDLRQVSKTFPGLRALDSVSLQVYSGEIVAIVGQNGSGKSTLVKILAGVHRADPGGEIRVRDEHGAVLTSKAAQARLHFIHQDLGLVPSLSTVENLDLGRRLGARAWCRAHVREEVRRARQMVAEYGASFEVEIPIAELTPAERTIVAIARALDGWTDARNVLVLDEPTASLHGEEVAKLFRAVRRVAEYGAGVIFISHRLDEVTDLADRIVVLRDGRVVGDARRDEFDHDQLVHMIVGNEVEAVGAGSSNPSADAMLQVRGVSGGNLRDFDLDLRAGEIVGVTGLLGSGREQIVAMLSGAMPRSTGEVRVAGTLLRPSDPRAAIECGVAYAPADRHRHGAVLTMRIRENLTLPRLAPLRRWFGSIDTALERREVSDWLLRVDVRPRDPDRVLAHLSGGNQQKVMLAKWLRNGPLVLLLDDPTQGVDVGAKAAIYRLIVEAAADGTAVLMASSETKELAVLCHRVIVLRDGHTVSEVSGTELSEARLVRESLGLALDQATAPVRRAGEAAGA